MNGTRRFLGLGIIAGALALLWVGSRWAAGPSYVTLYRDLELSGAGNITDDRTKSGIAYRLEDGGSTVLVGQGDVAQRTSAAREGRPPGRRGGPAWSCSSKSVLADAELHQRITYRRALEGELSRTIGTLRGVEPRPGPPRRYPSRARSGSSSVRRRRQWSSASSRALVLGPEVVQGIAYIVSNSVEQLPADNVAVMDDSGRLLSVPAHNGGVRRAHHPPARICSASVERQLSEKAEGMLATVVGAGQSRVQVSALPNFEQVEKTVESYDPDGAVLGTEQRSETTPEGDDGTGPGSQTIISNSYQNSKKVERIIGSVGNINHLSVAVLVNQKVLGTDAQSPASRAPCETPSASTPPAATGSP